MPNCPNCGAPAAPQGAQAGPNFGQPNPQGQPNFRHQPNPQGQPNFAQQPYPQGQPNFAQQPYPQKLSKREFLHHPNLKKCCSNIKGSAITLYVCAVITAILSIFVLGNIFAIVDVAIVVGLGLGIHLGQSRVCAIICLVYAAFTFIYMTIENGRASGYLILIAAIYAVIATFQFQKAWKEYQLTGILPQPK